MGVKVRKIRGKYYLVIHYHGKRKTRVIGRDRKIAEEVRRRVEAKLALGDTGIFDKKQDEQESGEAVPIFSDYAAHWLDSYARVELKRSTLRSYEQLLRLHVIPQFGQLQLSHIKRDDIKSFWANCPVRQRRLTLRLRPVRLPSASSLATRCG